MEMIAKESSMEMMFTLNSCLHDVLYYAFCEAIMHHGQALFLYQDSKVFTYVILVPDTLFVPCLTLA